MLMQPLYLQMYLSLIGGLPIYETIPLTELNRPGKVSTDNQRLDHC